MTEHRKYKKQKNVYNSNAYKTYLNLELEINLYVFGCYV